MRFPLTTVAHPSCPSNDNIRSLMSAYYPSLHRIATRRLSCVSTSVVDADDAVNSAFLMFWEGLMREQFTITCDTDVMYILRMIVGRKCNVIIRDLRYGKRDDSRTISISHMRHGKDNKRSGEEWIMGNDPDPSSTLAAADMLSFCLSRLSDLDRQILSYRLEGWNQAETAEVLDIDPTYVSKRMLSIRSVVAQMN